MDIKKEEILKIIKANGFSEEQGEQILEMMAKGLGGSILDIIALVASKIENPSIASVASMIIGALMPKAKEAVKKIEVNL